ncbi:hypothetical protein AFCA_006361 [Aspergillus flavus]|nr:hypothetical protein AFCA_006361 [Aspergillus flavus]
MWVNLMCSLSSTNATDRLSADTFRNPDNTEIQIALDIFFERIYPLPGYAFLHRASLYDRFHRGQADQSLLLSIIAISISLTETDSSKREYAAQCLKRAEQLIINNLSQPSIIRTQALLLILRCMMCLGEYSSAFPLVSLLSRFAFSLRLNYDNQRVCFLAREARRRLMWAIYMLDQTWAAGLLEFTTCPVDAIYVGLPCPEETWELDVCPETDVQLKSQTKLPGLLAANVGVCYLRDKVLRYERDLKDLIDETQDQNAHPENRHRNIQQQGPRQILSIHSLIARSEFVDDSEELAFQDAHAGDNASVYQKDNHEYSGPLDTLGLPSPLPSFDSVEGMTPGPTMTSQMWLQGPNAFEGAWDEPGIGFDLIRQMQWDGMGYFG